MLLIAFVSYMLIGKWVIWTYMLQSHEEKSMEHLLSYKEVLKQQGNRHWCQELYFDLDVYMSQG
jgi:hypothetical protein